MQLHGYAGALLYVDLNERTFREAPSGPYVDKFIGGRGVAAALFRELVPADAGASDPRNALVCATGPATGFTGLAGCRWVIGGKSPSRDPEMFSYGNLGGRWGIALKAAGYDALAVIGKAEAPVTLFIHDGTVEFRDAADLWGTTTFEAQERLVAELGKHTSVLAIGPAAEHGVVFATALADAGASVSGGMGAVMGAKNLKAVAVAGTGRPAAAHPERLREITDFVRMVRKASFDAPSPWAIPGLTVPQPCSGCGVGCTRQSYRLADGRRYKSFCQASGFYASPGTLEEGEDGGVPLMATRLCDGYGLDSAAMAGLIGWLHDCYREGVVTEAQTGLPFREFGGGAFFEKLVHLLASREGFGEVLARGTLKAAEALGGRARELAARSISTRTNENKDYDPRLILTTALLLATEPRKPVSQLHGISGNILISWTGWARGEEGAFFSTDDLRLAAKRFWGGEPAADFSTCEGKALAAKKVQDRAYVQESLVLCDVHWPMTVTSKDFSSGHVGDPALESRLYSAITGRETTEAELYQKGEAIFNLQRANLLRHGWGGRDGDRVLDYFFTEPLQRGEVFFNPDGIMPGKDGELISRLGKTLDREGFQTMLADYYRLRGWDGNGYPTRERLVELGLEDVAEELNVT
jgi:aldehyde:ferredoxin oxidoreductase